MSERTELNALHAQLLAEFNKGFPDTTKCADLLEKLKVNLFCRLKISKQISILKNRLVPSDRLDTHRVPTFSWSTRR